MFTENLLENTFEEFIKEKFPNSIIEENTFSVFTSFDEEKDTLKNGVGLRINIDPLLIKFSGKDTLDFLHRISTNSLKDVATNKQKNTLFLNEKGKFIARSTFASVENEYLLISDNDQFSRLYSWINKFIIIEDIKTENITGRYSLLEFFGPQTKSFLMLLLGDELNNLNEEDFKRFDVDGFTFYMYFSKENSNVAVFKLLVEKPRLIDFFNHLFSIKSVFDLNCIGEKAFNWFRIKNLIPKFPNEINNEVNPHEVSLMNEVSTTKGCYIGQEVVARLDTYDKVQKKLIKAEIPNLQLNHIKNNAIYSLDNVEVGQITTKNFDGCNTLLCLIKKNFLDGQSEINVKIDDQLVLLKNLDANFRK